MLSLPSWLLTSRTLDTYANTIATEPELSLSIFSGTPEVFHVIASSYLRRCEECVTSLPVCVFIHMLAWVLLLPL